MGPRGAPRGRAVPSLPQGRARGAEGSALSVREDEMLALAAEGSTPKPSHEER